MGEAVAKGEKFFNEITAKKLKNLMEETDLKNSFEDAFDFSDPTKF